MRLCIAYFLLLFAVGITALRPSDPNPLPIGATAPEFNLPGVDGKTYSLASFSSSKVLAIVFTCVHCPTAQAYEQRIMELASDYRSQGVAIVAISPNDPKSVRLDELGYTDLSDSFDEMKIRAAERGFNFPFLYDGETQIASRAYGAVATPHVFIFDGERKLRYQGRIDDVENPRKTPNTRDTRNAIEALLADREVTINSTKVFGCSVKWAEKQEEGQKYRDRWAAEPVTLEMIDEKGLRELIANTSDKLRLINVWATWCGPCVAEFPEFVTINRMYRDRDFEFISISADDPNKSETVLKFLTRKECSAKNYHFSVEDKYKLIEAIDPKWQGALPYTILVEPGGKIVYARQGAIEPLKMKKMIVENHLLGRYY